MQGPGRFPSPADDYIENTLDLNERYIKHPSDTFFCKATDNALWGRGIFAGDIVMVDKSLKPITGDVVLVCLNGDWIMRILDIHNRRLLSSNKHYPTLNILEGSDFDIIGVVPMNIRDHHQ